MSVGLLGLVILIGVVLLFIGLLGLTRRSSSENSSETPPGSSWKSLLQKPATLTCWHCGQLTAAGNDECEHCGKELR